ncbi:hypothetical protein BCR33DRAFT_763088 [Rhizoclosmatium globosum]|uniref:ABC transporter domain-containing protein n=1 Tax=Rhizoclosmatium globosum TaxID=329046 RepID=A0A1Y2CSV8_9FUNG|nr:hypothetical protein BCR33DRAFT_763088 [Rhizoclosmatium globosum]|eukprot:ORY50037.1 hypothetical protein BCR33DRAFT_763088 [Rhizoclosmatium globosum]
MSGVWDYTALPGNPFVVNGQRLKGKPWILPPLEPTSPSRKALALDTAVSATQHNQSETPLTSLGTTLRQSRSKTLAGQECSALPKDLTACQSSQEGSESSPTTFSTPSDLTATTIPEKLVSSANHSQSENISALTASVHKSLNGQDNLQMTYDFEGLSLKLPDGKMILQGVTGAVKAGRMTAIMGPSGAGKTTFMNVLMGKVARTAGTLKINGTVAEMASFKKIIGYVPQEDTMIEELTNSFAKLVDNAEVENHVDAILKALNLAHVAHKRIGNVLERGISGGQRKRVNIGLELAAAPLTVFLMNPPPVSIPLEPSTQSTSCTQSPVSASQSSPLRRRPHDRPGRPHLVLWPCRGAKPYFEDLGFEFKPTANDADTLMDILAGHLEVPETNSAAYVGGTTQLDEIAKARGASFIRQVGLSHNRSIAQQIRLISGFVMELLVGMLCGGIMGFACNGGESVYGMMNYPYTALSPGPNYWFLAILLPWKNLSVIYRIALASAHFVALYYFLAQPPISLGLQYVLIFLNFFGIYGLGMIISMIVRRENAPILAVTTALITEVLCGFGPTLKQAVKEKFDFIMDIGVNRWMCEAQFALWLQPYQNVYSFEEATNQFGYQFGNTNRNIGAMIGIGLAYRAIAGILFVMS